MEGTQRACIRRAAAPYLRQKRRVGDKAAADHHRLYRVQARMQRRILLRRDNIAVIAHRRADRRKRAGESVQTRRAFVKVRAHARMNDQLGDGVAVENFNQAIKLLFFSKAQTCFDTDPDVDL